MDNIVEYTTFATDTIEVRTDFSPQSINFASLMSLALMLVTTIPTAHAPTASQLLLIWKSYYWIEVVQVKAETLTCWF